MKVVFIEGHSPDDELAKACASIGMFRYANMADFKIADPKLVTEVYTDNEDIRSAYEEVGIVVHPLPSVVAETNTGTNTDKKPHKRGSSNNTPTDGGAK